MWHPRDRPELLQQAEPVPLLPFINVLAVGEPKDADAAGPDALAGGWYALQFALVRARARVADRHLIVLRNQVFEADARVGEGGNVRGPGLLGSGQSGRLPELGGMVHVILHHELVESIQPLPVPNLVQHAPHDRLVVVCDRHGRLLESWMWSPL